MNRKKILIATQDFPPEKGGIQLYVSELAGQLLKRGHEVTVICPGRNSDPSPLPPGVEIIRVRIHSSWLFLPLLFRLPGLLRRKKFTHVLYAQWQVALAERLLPGRFKRHQSLCLVHGRELLTSIFGPVHGLLCRAALDGIDVAIPNSRAVEALLREKTAAVRVVRVNPGVDPVRFHPADAAFLRVRHGLGGDPVLFCVGRMVFRKGLDVLLRSFAEVRCRIPSVRLVLGGEGPEKPALTALADQLGIAGQVCFTGAIPDEELALYHALASVFVLPSRQGPRDIEGFGIVFLEAGGCEVPVVGTRTGGVADAVLDGITGLLVPQEDVSALTAALIRLLENPMESRAMGVAARARILKEFTWESVGDRILNLMA